MAHENNSDRVIRLGPLNVNISCPERSVRRAAA